MIALGLLLVSLPDRRYEAWLEERYGAMIFEERSEFSHIRVRQFGSIRSLLFVDKDGAEQRQSAADLDSPHALQLGYGRGLLLSLLFRHPQERVLMVGLGGGDMVRFINHALPETHVDAVEIDPAVVRVAADFFDVRSGSRTAIHTRDAFEFLGETAERYDVIYMDAFLKPPAGSDMGALTQRLKTEAFLGDVRGRLRPGGVVAFNLIEADSSTGADLAAIRAVFPSVYVFGVAGTGNLAVLATLEENRRSQEELRERAAELPENLTGELGFRELIGDLRDSEEGAR